MMHILESINNVLSSMHHIRSLCQGIRLDFSGVSHEFIEQLSALTLPVLGILVNGNEMTFTMTDDTEQKLIQSVDDFVQSKMKSLWACHALTGYVNWSLNVYPCLLPSLASLYSKMTGPYKPHKYIHINEDIVWDLSWLLHRLQNSSGVFLLQLVAWHLHEADLEIITDATLTGIGMWSLTILITFHGPVLSTCIDSHIFFHKAFIVCCAIHWAADLVWQSECCFCRVVISTDNSNTVNIFNSLKAPGVFNDLLKYVVNILMDHDFDLCVIHILGMSNTVADLLS